MVNGQSHVALPASRPRARKRALPTAFLLGIGIALAAPGDLDPDFGDSGLISLKLGGDFGGSSAEAALQQPDGKLVVAGFGDVIQENDDDWIVTRFGVDGTADSSFGSNGISTADYSGQFDGAFAAIRLNDGKLVLAGTVGANATESDFALARFSANGMLDASFGSGGWATVDLGGSDERASGLATTTTLRVVGRMTPEGLARTMVSDRLRGVFPQTMSPWYPVKRSRPERCRAAPR